MAVLTVKGASLNLRNEEVEAGETDQGDDWQAAARRPLSDRWRRCARARYGERLHERFYQH